MDFLPCDKRQKLIQFQADGTKKRVNQCMEPEAEKYGLTVLPSDCEACPLRNFKKPAKVDRTVKDLGLNLIRSEPDKGPSDVFPACPFRVLGTLALCCSQTFQVRICDSPDSPEYGKEVNASTCLNCPLRG